MKKKPTKTAKPQTASRKIWESNFAGYSLLWVTTAEPERLHEEIVRDTPENTSGKDEEECHVFRWDCQDGWFTRSKNAKPPGTGNVLFDEEVNQERDVVEAIMKIPNFRNNSICIMSMMHRFLSPTIEGSIETTQAIMNLIPFLRAMGKTLVICAPTPQGIPAELEKAAFMIQHEYPSADQIRLAMDTLASQYEDAEKLSEKKKTSVLEAAGGLTLPEAENAMSLSLTRTGKFDPGIVLDQKCAQIAKSDVLEVCQYPYGFERVGGLQALKDFLAKVMEAQASFQKKGVLLVGVPGVGKSLIAKCLGHQFNLPTIIFDMARCYGSLVGETEGKVRNAIMTIDAIGFCIVFMDEIEKAIAGGAQGGDSTGTSSRAFGQLLTWMNDQEKAFIIGTANNVTMLPPEFTRAGRWNGIYFVDIPTRSEREAIWKVHLSAYGLDHNLPRPNDANWTGAEIEQACQMATLHLDAGKEALQLGGNYVIPTYDTQKERLDALRRWAEGRCLSASIPGRYKIQETAMADAKETVGRRRVRRQNSEE